MRTMVGTFAVGDSSSLVILSRQERPEAQIFTMVQSQRSAEKRIKAQKHTLVEGREERLDVGVDLPRRRFAQVEVSLGNIAPARSC